MAPRRPVARTPTLVFEHHGGRGPLIVGCRCPAVVNGLRRHSSSDRARLGPERAPGIIPRQGYRGSSDFHRLLPWSLVLLTQTQVRHGGMPIVDTEDRRPRMPSRGGELELCWTEVAEVPLASS